MLLEQLGEVDELAVRDWAAGEWVGERGFVWSLKLWIFVWRYIFSSSQRADDAGSHGKQDHSRVVLQ